MHQIHFTTILHVVFGILSIRQTIGTTNDNIEFHLNDLSNREFRSVPTTVKTYENDTVLLPCDYKFPYSSLRWLKENIIIVDGRHAEEILLSHYRLLTNGSLEVNNVQPDDTGKYICEIIGGTFKGRQSHSIEVQYAPRVYITPNGLIELPIGAILEIICETEGIPRPAVIWTHNNKTVIDYMIGNRQSYIIEIQSRNMSGKISCTANNGVGQPVSDDVELSVLFIPEIYANQKVFYSKVGARIQLECEVKSAPLAKIKWWHDGRPIIFNNNHNYARLDLEIPAMGATVMRYYSYMKHILIIKNVRESDMGMYECRAENSIGVSSAYMELTFRPMPCIFKISPDAQSPTSHLLVWQTESYVPVIEFKLKFRQLPSENIVVVSTNVAAKSEWTELTIPADLSNGPIYTTSFTLYGLYPASIYEVVVFARNYFGWSDSSKILRFATGGEVELPYYTTEMDIHHNLNNDKSNSNDSNDNDNNDDDDDDDDSGNYTVNHRWQKNTDINGNNFAITKDMNDTMNGQHINENLLHAKFNIISGSSVIRINIMILTISFKFLLCIMWKCIFNC